MCYPPDPEPFGWLDRMLVLFAVATVLAAVVLAALAATRALR